jgi:hypothetical protein
MQNTRFDVVVLHFNFHYLIQTFSLTNFELQTLKLTLIYFKKIKLIIIVVICYNLPRNVTDSSMQTASTAAAQQSGTSPLAQSASSHSMLTLVTTAAPLSTKLHNTYTKQPLSSSYLSSSTSSLASSVTATTGLTGPAPSLLNGALMSPSEKQASKVPPPMHSSYNVSTSGSMHTPTITTSGSSLYGHKVHHSQQTSSSHLLHDRPLSPIAAASSTVSGAVKGAVKGPISPPNITIGTTTDPSCDSYGVCYQVSLRCTDSRILVQVRTSQPFHGRIYALGRSETCNNKIHNAQHFSLEMSLAGQDCNTQSVQGVYSNTVVLQHHNVVLTKADKVSPLARLFLLLY